jgi:radical SAM superfamily enzyme YgiQ (UPF0313 family)
MRILLLNPINRTYVIMPSLGLGYLAAVLRKQGHVVTVLNCVKERLTHEAFSVLLQTEQYDVIGFQVFTYDLNPVKRHLEIVKQVSPATVTIAGGPHPSGDPERTLAYLEKLDFAFQGEAEIGLPLLLENLCGRERNLACIPGLVWRNNGTILANPPCFVEDLDTIPLPAWDLLRPENYPEAPHGAFTKGFPTSPIIITRGCASGCTFCAGSRINGYRIRRRSLGNVLAELRHLAERGIREFHIEDENFTESSEFVLEFCQRLSEEHLGMSWSLPSGVRLDNLTREMLTAMAKAGCYSLAVGIEFGSDRLLRMTGKGLTLEMIRERVKLFDGLGIKLTGFFMFGIPGETREEMADTVRLALELPLDRAQFNNFMPLPGSLEWEKLSKAGRLNAVDWDRFFVHDVPYTDGVVSAKELKWIQRNALIRFYFRPRIMIGVIREIRSFRHMMYLVKRFADALT